MKSFELIIKKESGLSMVELLVAMAVLSVIGVLVTGIFSRAFVGVDKTELISRVKNNGDFVLTSLGLAIRNADSIVCYAKSDGIHVDTIAVLDKAGLYTKYRFRMPVTDQAGKVTKNGYVAKGSTSNPDPDTFCSLPTPPVNGDLLTGEVFLTNTDTVSGINIRDGEFKRISGFEGNDIVEIKFKVGPPLSPLSSPDAIEFKTTIQVR